MIKKMDNTGIDFVLPWVDGSDPQWRKEKEQYEVKRGDDDREIRYRDFNLLKYWFRGVETNADWVGNIYFITWGHLPPWLNKDHPKLKIINHRDYIPEQYLPTFSSHVIECNLHRIPSLSEDFVYFNDDIFILKPLKPEDFFREGKICDCMVQTAITPQLHEFSSILCETTGVINKHFTKKDIQKLGLRKIFNPRYRELLIRVISTLPYTHLMGIYNPHICYAHKKSTFELLWKLEYDELDATCRNRFRGKNDVNQYLFRYWNLCKGDFYPVYPIGKYITLASDAKTIVKEMRRRRNKVIAVNDSIYAGDFDRKMESIREELERLYPQRSSYELF